MRKIKLQNIYFLSYSNKTVLTIFSNTTSDVKSFVIRGFLKIEKF